MGVADKVTVTKIITENIARESKLHTDESKLYFGADEHFAEHESVKHSAKEYVRSKFTWGEEGPKTEKVHTNSAEGYFSIFMRGIYQHCGESICIVTLPSMTFATIIGSNSASTIRIVRPLP